MYVSSHIFQAVPDMTALAEFESTYYIQEQLTLIESSSSWSSAKAEVWHSLCFLDQLLYLIPGSLASKIAIAGLSLKALPAVS